MVAPDFSSAARALPEMVTPRSTSALVSSPVPRIFTAGRWPRAAAGEPPRDQRRRRDGLAGLIRRFERREIDHAHRDAVDLHRAGAVLAVAAALRQLLDKIAPLRTDLVAGAGGLPLAATAAGLAALAAA